MLAKHHRSLQLISTILLVILTTSCAAAPNVIPAAAAPGLPSPTPFQPQPGLVDAPYLAPSLAQAEPTYTPYPTPYVPAAILSTPSQNIGDPNGDPENSLVPNNPLTGLPADDASLLERRPMAVKITNAPDYVRPQSGLTLADVVYEYYIEWGETRFIAVFYGSDSPMAGPVRSGRYFDEHITRMYHAYLVFKYADPREYTYFKDSDLLPFLMVPGNGACPPYVIGKTKRDTYNNIFFNTVKFGDCLERQGLDNAKQALRSGFFSDEPLTSSLAVNRVYFRYSPQSYNYWEYDGPTHKYFRYQESQDMHTGKPEAYAPLMDAVNGLPVTADNVVALFVPHTFANQWDQEDEVYHIDIVDSGDAFVFRDGTAIPARWYRTDIDQPILLVALDGTPIFLRPGRTFYQVLGESSTYQQNGTDWKFQFLTP